MKIIDIAYIVDESVPKGICEASIMDIDFILDDNSQIKQDLLTVYINVLRDATSLEFIRNSSFYAYSVENILRIESPHEELIKIYSITGIQLYSAKKTAGSFEIPCASLPGSVFIIHGSVSGTIKVMK